SVVPTPTSVITSNPASNTICAGDVIVLNASGGTTYSWSNGSLGSSISVSPSTSTSYTVSASNGVCADTSKITVSVLPAPHALISGNTNICQGTTASLTAFGGGTYSWSSGETTATIHPSASGNYSVLVTVGTCTDETSANVIVHPNPTAIAYSNTTIIQGQSANLSATGGVNYVWDNGMNGANITVTPMVTTTFCVTVYDVNNCKNDTCVKVTVELCSQAGTLYLPDAFSPNGDGVNDSLRIYYGIPMCIKSLHLVLYDRWGEKVYETNDPGFRWDGVYNKGILKNSQPGGTEVYAYYMDVEIVDGNRISKKGNISLVR
ncbi:MAG TPA: gliding motility-associated C-terminal domain-containing protein, partial [Bacteroidia bacterium]